VGEAEIQAENRDEVQVESPVLPRLRERFGQSLLEVKVWRNETTVVVRPQDLQGVCRFLRDDPALSFDFLSDLTGVDRLKLPESSPRFEVVYHL
jgi:NADH-quinone oxidoreductase subunit C